MTNKLTAALSLLLLSSALSIAAADDLQAGSYDRFWRHLVDEKSLMVDSINHYFNIENCLKDKLGADIYQNLGNYNSPNRKTGLKLQEIDGTVYLVAIHNAMSETHVKAVQSLAACVRQYIPSLYESRAMYQEMDLDEDTGLGGNCPTHLAPLVSVFLPAVRAEMNAVLQHAFDVAGWKELVERDQEYELPRAKAIPEPKDAGVRASEHLTYRDFPQLAEHTDGDTTAYTMNFAFSGPDDYQGGAFYILDHSTGRKRFIKPNPRDCLVFLGGRYLHAVAEITGGNREMFSTEWWPYPDLPFGSNLWTAAPENMEEYIKRCNKQDGVDKKCTAEYPKTTWSGMTVEQVKEKYGNVNESGGNKSSRPNRVQPHALVPIRLKDPQTGREYDLSDFIPAEQEPDFLIPSKLEPGEMVPIRWRDTLTPIDGVDSESFVIGFPPELHEEFVKYIEKNGMMKVAKQILYDEMPLKPSEHRIYTLDDGQKWGAMVQGSWETDMVWLDPADEESFESLLGVLRRGNFDVVLDQVGKAFDLNGLMVQGVGAIFLSEYQVSDNMHVDIQRSKGSFYNIIVPVHIPVGHTAKFYVGDHEDEDRIGTVNMDPNVGIVLGGESSHGTGECSYRKDKEFRLSFAVYVADINDDNVELIASDSTSLWPTDGDTEWFRAQQGRLWSKDGSASLKNDKGRKPLHVQDKHPKCSKSQHLCEKDIKGMRLLCPKTCKLYLEDDVYYSKLFSEGGNPAPTCSQQGPDGTAQC